MRGISIHNQILALLAAFSVSFAAQADEITDGNYITMESQFPSGLPAYKSSEQAIYWVSGQAGPGDSILVSGAFTDTPKTVKIVQVADNTPDWKTLLSQKASLTKATLMGSSGLAIQVPSNFSKTVYAFRIGDESPTAVFGVANQPKINWMMGMNPPVVPSNVQAGRVLRVFGENFPEGARVFLLTPTGKAVTLLPSSSDASSLSVGIPGSFAPGVYQLRVGRGAGIAPGLLASDYARLSIVSPVQAPTASVDCRGLVGNGVADDSAALQACLDNARGSSTASSALMIKLPIGKFLISKKITIYPNQRLVGKGRDLSVIRGSMSAPVTTDAWIEGSHHWGLADLALEAPIYRHLVRSQDSVAADWKTIGDPKIAGHISISGIRLVVLRSPAKTVRAVAALNLSGPDIRVTGSIIDNVQTYTETPYDNHAIAIAVGNGAYVSGNTMLLGARGLGLVSQSSRNLIYDQNALDGSKGSIGVSGASISRNKMGPTENLHISSNTYVGFPENPNEAITTDSSGGTYIGYVRSTKGVNMVLAGDPAWALAPLPIKTGFVVSIIAGRGVGQFRYINSVTDRNVVLSGAWTVTPDASSIVSITPYQRNLTITRNSIKNFGPSIQFYGMVFDGLIQENKIADSGSMVLRSLKYGVGTGLPIFNAQILDNVFSGALASLVMKETGVGTYISGVLVRNNKFDPAAELNIGQTNFWRFLSVLSEKNAMSVAPTSISRAQSSVPVLLKEAE